MLPHVGHILISKMLVPYFAVDKKESAPLQVLLLKFNSHALIATTEKILQFHKFYGICKYFSFNEVKSKVNSSS